MRSLIKNRKLGFILTLAGALGVAMLSVNTARANHAGCAPMFYNRCVGHGYFAGQPYSQGTYVMSTGQPAKFNSRGGMPVYNVNEFVGYINNRLYDGSPGDKYQDTTGAAFIINTMLARWGTDYGNRDAGVIYARNNFAEWEKRVRWYDSQGLIEWDRKYAYPVGFENSLYSRGTGDNAYVNHPEYQEEYTIMFFAPGFGPTSPTPYRHFQIKKNCGNPIGTLPGLQPVPATEGVIQGYKVVNPGANPTIEPPKSALITSSHKGGRTTRNNPYFFTDVPADPDGPGGPARAYHRVTAEVPPGWRVGYNVCYTNNPAAAWRNPCDNGKDGVTWGNSVVVDVYPGNPVNVWWYYERLSPPAPDVSVSCVAGVSTASIRWTEAGRGRTEYSVDIDDESNFRAYDNKWVPSGTLNTDTASGWYVPGGRLNLRNGGRYWVRIWYPNTREHSVTKEFTVPGCWAFTVNPPTVTVTASPDVENPQSIRFVSTFAVTYTPGGQPSGIRLSTTREYYILRYNPANPSAPTREPYRPNPVINEVNQRFPASRGEYDDTRPAPTLAAGDKVCMRFTVTPRSGTVDPDGTVRLASGPPLEAIGCETISNKPYFRVYNGDIAAGSTTGCPGWGHIGNAQINSWWNITDSRGAGTQLAAFAMGKINEFASATGRTPDPKPPKGLSFSNTFEAYGGNFQSGACAPDYYAEAENAAKTRTMTAGSVDIGTLSGSAFKSGNITISGSLANRQKVALYVEGDVFINNNIAYATTANWSGVNDIPNFSLIVLGNIFIAPNVTNLDGLYVAHPWTTDGSYGEILTCAPASTLPNAAQLLNECKTQLTVNGAFIAKRVRLLRTYGSLKDSCTLEPRGVPAPAASPAPCTSSKMAERFIFSPEAWMSSSIEPGSNNTLFEAITSLPPVL